MPLVFWFVATPLVELFLLGKLTALFGLGPTLLLCVATGIVGAALTRSQGMATLVRVQERLAAGRTPEIEIVEGLLILIAGVVLLTPGVLTDFAGLLLLVPASRAVVARALLGRFQQKARNFGSPGPKFSDENSRHSEASGSSRAGKVAKTRGERQRGKRIVDAEFKSREE